MKRWLVTIALPFVYKWAIRAAKRALNSLWDVMWADIIEAIRDAELIYKAEKMGAVRKEWVLDRVTSFLDDKGISGLKRAAIMRLVRYTVDRMIFKLNKTSKRWVIYVKDVKGYLEDVIPVID